jgi:hypothetical protein
MVIGASFDTPERDAQIAQAGQPPAIARNVKNSCGRCVIFRQK